MRIKVDENLSVVIARELRSLGHDAEHVRDEGLTGAPDPEVWAAAQREQRFLITQDVRFTDLRVLGRESHSGLLLIRLKEPDIFTLIALVCELFVRPDVESWHGCVVVRSDVGLRIRGRR